MKLFFNYSLLWQYKRTIMDAKIHTNTNTIKYIYVYAHTHIYISCTLQGNRIISAGEQRLVMIYIHRFYQFLSTIFTL